MARQNLRPNPAMKHMHTYSDFSGGLNTVDAEEKIQDNESPNLVNVDIGERGSLKRRHGMVKHIDLLGKTNGQGFFRYFKAGGTYEEIIASNGKLYLKKPVVSNPTTAPALVAQADPDTTTALAAATYYVKYTWSNGNGETLSSPNASVAITAGQEIKVTLPTFPTNVTSANIYISTTSGSETKQGSTTTTTHIQSKALVAGTALPTVNTTDSVKELPITNLTSFQTTRDIEAVQFRDKLYIATGTKLVEYDGTSAKVVVPHKPEPLEALYIGTNGLADDPDNFMQNGESTFLRLDGVTFNRRYGIINQPITLTAYVSKPSTMSVEYKFEKRTTVQRDGFWELGRDYTTDPKYTFTTDYEGDVQFRVWVREVGKTDAEAKQFYVPKYKIKPTADPNDQDLPVDTIHSCNRIVLHWNRLIMYGDVNQPDAIFISHLDNPAYFPVPNSLIFESEKRDRITKLVRYRDMLVAFTPTSIQALFGKSPLDYHRTMLNSAIGCIAPNSARVLENNIVFLSNEGVHILKSVGYTESKVNVEKIDTKVSNIIHRDTNAYGVVQDNQYHLVFPDKKERFRFYYEIGSWTRDKSDKLDLISLVQVDGVLFGQSKANGNIFRFDKTVFNDDTFIYEDRMELKYFDFGEPYNPKKLKELQLILANQNKVTKILTEVYADASLVLGGDTSYASVDASGNVTWVYESNPNLEVYSGTTLGTWEMSESPFGEIASEVYKAKLKGKGRKMKIILSHSDETPIQLIGFGCIFKSKKP